MDPASSDRPVVVCTGNAHKVDELAMLLPDLRLEALPAGTELPPEVGNTFLDNARIKAHAGQALHPDRFVLADDSGLIVDVLDGAPGVHSARFSGEDATDEANVELLLRRMATITDPELRSARFACVLVLVAPGGDELHVTGHVEGTIAAEPAGDSGFGYDPVFVPAGHERTFAQLGASIKAELSHRARAARELASLLGGA
jgi:XTP/dITP diphosphohydrolase